MLSFRTRRRCSRPAALLGHSSLQCPLSDVSPPCVSMQAPTLDPREPRAAKAALAPSRTASCWGWTEPPGMRVVCAVPPASSRSLPPAGAGTPNCTAGAITSGKTPSPGPLLSPALFLCPVPSLKSFNKCRFFTNPSTLTSLRFSLSSAPSIRPFNFTGLQIEIFHWIQVPHPVLFFSRVHVFY